ncbi:MAG TPA: hypothetical protein VGF38_12510 [Ktedonobacterales bacterium]|jgi:hypothetical protein
MSDRHDDQRDRERQYEIDRITFQYATEFRSGRNPRIEEYVKRYPEYTGELLEYALYFHTIGFDSEPLEEPAELSLSPAGEKVMAWVREQVTAAKPAPVAIQSLVQLGLDANYSPPQLAAAVGLTVDLLGKLQAHAIAAATIPRALIQRFGDVLKTAPEAIAAYLGASPAGGFYMAERQPDQQQESFLDAVEASALSPEGKREWAEIVNAEANSSSSP